jgi:hypothetical protein
MHPRRFSLVLCLFAAAGCAATPASVGGPVTGFIFDAQAGAIRPMMGIPGAAYLGAPAVSGVGAASVAPDGSAALALQSGRLMLYTGLRGFAPAPTTISGALSGIDRFAWAPDSSAAAVYASKTGQAQILTGLAQSPAAGVPFAVSAIPGTVTALAFDGRLIIIGAVSEGSGGVYIADAQSPAQRIASAVSPSAIALAGADLYFSDNQSQQIWQVQGYSQIPAAVLFSKGGGISLPAGLQVSSDNSRLYVANAGSRKLAVYEIASRALVQILDLAFTPTRLERFGANAAFVLNGTGQGPIYVLTDSRPQPAVYFVPAPRARAPKARVRPI